jgi:hypothetical protein
MTLKLTALAGLLALCVTTVAQAATFTFTYGLSTGNVLHGTLTGTVAQDDSNKVLGAFITSFGVNASTGATLVADITEFSLGGSYLRTGSLGLVTFDGSTMDIQAYSSSDPVFRFHMVKNFPVRATYGFAGAALTSGAFTPATWRLTQVAAPAPVPLPASAPLVLAGIGALVALRRKRG